MRRALRIKSNTHLSQYDWRSTQWHSVYADTFGYFAWYSIIYFILFIKLRFSWSSPKYSTFRVGNRTILFFLSNSKHNLSLHGLTLKLHHGPKSVLFCVAKTLSDYDDSRALNGYCTFTDHKWCNQACHKYWIKKCAIHISHGLFLCSLFSGHRRDSCMFKWTQLIQYLRDFHRQTEEEEEKSSLHFIEIYIWYSIRNSYLALEKERKQCCYLFYCASTCE